MINPYTVLGVKPNATNEEIKRAYLKKVKKLHPDRQGGEASSSIAFLRVQEAFELIGTRDSRATYDWRRTAGINVHSAPAYDHSVSFLEKYTHKHRCCRFYRVY